MLNVYPLQSMQRIGESSDTTGAFTKPKERNRRI
jgi:hypothetical protein